MNKFFARWPNGRELVFRSLSWAEHRRFMSARQDYPEMLVYTDVYRTAVLEGPPADTATAGLVAFIGDTLLEQSPYSGAFPLVQQALAIKRTELQGNYLKAARAVVGSLFQKSDVEMDAWDAETFFDYVARAEFVSGRKLDPADPTAKKPEPKGKAKRPLPQQGIVEQQVTATREPGPPPEDPAPRLTRRPLTPAQQIVVDRRMRRA